ncbi:MAG: ABC transporter permease [Dermatophilaceae bacterium]
MTVTQLWVTKGVAARLMTAVDRKSLLLNWVVLAASGLVVANAVFASVRARRREIGTARAVGWTRLAVLRHVLVPVLSAAVGAGLAGLVLAVVVRVLLAGSGVAVGQRSAALREVFTNADLWRTVALAPPVAFGVALLTALPPAVYASRISPLSATRAPLSRAGARVPRRVRSVTGLATRSVVAAPGRAVAGLLGVLVATAGLGALLAIQAQLHGRAVGTLLGDAVAVEVRAPDVAAVLGTAALAGVGIAHLIGTEIRERATEFAGLRAIGWTEATIARLVVTHAALVALARAALGAGLAWWFVESAFGGATARWRWRLWEPADWPSSAPP